MLAYAAHRRTLAQGRSAPNVMLVIIGAHVAGIAVLMSARMDVPIIDRIKPTIFELLPAEPVPPRNDPLPSPPEPQASTLDRPVPLVPTPPLDLPTTDPTPVPLPDLGKIIGPAPDPGPKVDPLPTPAPVRTSAQLITPASRLKLLAPRAVQSRRRASQVASRMQGATARTGSRRRRAQDANHCR